ncbi:helix-turn-helix transcriptional regulator [Flavobacterium sp. MAH-1]|uniref:Helix-turn-helix transcriptional regulator n=1 Tax=Flavobacterium agri TaxID=2743471 RepID=A0A7Y8Y0F7_9FLAO|nr:helix-turn-helix transcriptional regulator [Flavobacterium agri]NUY80077.1 helix-turn-helix transcriptional regulator [Flavobacterium agri]NYA70102.1 helix-turn-helix transcriptional regulator [Flavobacterium agri]
MVSERVGQYIEKKGISYYAFENSLGASRGSISKAVKEGKSIGSNVLENIMGIYTDLNPNWLLTGHGEMFIGSADASVSREVQTFRLKTDNSLEQQQIPLYDIEAFAGLVPLFQNAKSKDPIDHISIPRLPKCDGAVYVTGDSMYPLLKSGDIVLYKEVRDIRNEIFWGEMYLLSIETSEEEYITVKYIQKAEREGYVRLVSQNQHHQDKDVELSKIKALALIKASIRINAMR